MRSVQDHDWSLARHRGGAVVAGLMGALAVLSAVRLSGPPWALHFQVTTTTALFVAIAFIPWVLNRIVDRGGSVRLPGGVELAMDSREAREVGLPGLAATNFEVESRLTRLAGEYERWRGTASTWERTQHLERVLAEARLLAGAASEQIVGRLERFESADDGSRAMTVALIEGAVAVPGKTAAILIDGLSAPRSAFEEYHLLTAVRLHLARFPKAERQSIIGQVSRKLEDGSWPPGTDRRRIAKRILEEAAS